MQVRTGFTLIEVLIASVIAVVVLLGLLAAAIYFENYSVKRALMKEASNILYSKLEEVKSLPYSEVTETNLNNGAVDCEDALTKNYLERYVGNVRYRFGLFYKVTPDPSYQVKEVNLTVCWKYRGKLHEISGNTIVRNKQ